MAAAPGTATYDERDDHLLEVFSSAAELTGVAGSDAADWYVHAAQAHLPVLLITTAHLTGDPSLLRPEWRPRLAEDGGLLPLPSAEDRRARWECAGRLAAWAGAGEVGVEAVDPELAAAVLRWVGLERSAAHLGMILEEATPFGVDAKAPRWHRDELAAGRQLLVTVIGAGISGLVVAHRLRQAGVPVTVLEKNPSVGGTWFENAYPGCRVDVPSELYSYSFARRSSWQHHFSEQPVWLEYLQGVARATGVEECVRFGTEVLAARWSTDHWVLTVRDEAGTHELVTDVLVPAVGQLNRPALPRIPGRETFAGPAFHSAEWRSDVVMSGRRVGVIGTGASAFQFVPAIAGEAASVTVFQRTPPWLLPTPDYHEPVGETMRWLHKRLPVHSAWYRVWLLLLEPALADMPGRCAVDPDFPPTEQAVSAANDRLRELFTARIAAQVGDDPELFRQVLPRYPVGAKRMLRDDGLWLATLRRQDVELVTEPIAEVGPGGVRTHDGREHGLDVLIYGTGFRAQDFLAPMEIVGRGGQDLRRWWAGEPRAHLGLAVPGFPNLFCMYGPNTNLVVQGGSITHLAECQAQYVIDAVRQLLARGARVLEVRPEVYERAGAEIDRANAQQAWGWSGVSSWYKNASGRVTQSWPFLTSDYWQRTRQVACDQYDWM